MAVDNVGGGVRSEGRGGRAEGGSDTGYRSPPLVLICCIARPATPIPFLHTYITIPPSPSYTCPSRAHVGTYAAYVNASMCARITMCFANVCVGVRILCTYAFSTEFSLFVTDTVFFILLENFPVLGKYVFNKKFFRICYYTHTLSFSLSSVYIALITKPNYY